VDLAISKFLLEGLDILDYSRHIPQEMRERAIKINFALSHFFFTMVLNVPDSPPRNTQLFVVEGTKGSNPSIMYMHHTVLVQERYLDSS